MGTSKLGLALSAFIGAGAALMTTVAVGTLGGGDPPTALARSGDPAKPTQTTRSVEVKAASGRLEALEQAVARLHGERDGQREDPPAELPSPEEERASVAARFAELEQRLLADPVDPAWSGGATESLRKDLGAVAEQDGFELIAAECRTEMCRATLRWTSYEAAVKTGMRLPERTIPGLNCAASIWLDEPDRPAGAYSSNLFLDCSEQRAGKVDVVQ